MQQPVRVDTQNSVTRRVVANIPACNATVGPEKQMHLIRILVQGHCARMQKHRFTWRAVVRAFEERPLLVHARNKLCVHKSNRFT